MKVYELKVKNSNGFWAHKKFITKSSDKKAYDYAKQKTLETGFEHKAEFFSKVEKTEDVKKKDQDSKEPVQTDQSEEVSNSNDINFDESLTMEEFQIINEHNPSDFNPDEYDFELGYDEKEFPRAWWLKNVFVAKDGTVFHLKEENPKLYRKLKPTDY